MKHVLKLLAAVIAFVATATCMQAKEAHSQRIWLSGVDPFVRKTMNASPSDYMKLFQERDSWKEAASHLDVFKTSTQWILNGSDDDLRQMFAALKRRKISLAMEALILTSSREECGQGVEGYSSPLTMLRAAERVKSLGGELAYIAFDEPLWFGHIFAGKNACQTPLPDLARTVAKGVTEVRQVFPRVQVGDIEPVSQLQSIPLLDTFLNWVDALGEAGVFLDFFHVDIDWVMNSDRELISLKNELDARSIRFGIIYNGDEDDQDDVAWAKNAEERFEFVETQLNIIPSDVVLQTWMRRPANMVPEVTPGTMTNLVNRYARKRTKLTLSADAERFYARLTDADEKPIANAKISISALQDGRSGPLASLIREGQVPQAAVSALIALRLNAECRCAGTGDVTIGTMKYGDSGGEKRVAMGQLMQDGAFEYSVGRGQVVKANSQTFAVWPGSYHLDIPLRTSVDVGRAGYLAVIFLSRDGREIGRRKIALRQSTLPLATLSTNLQGEVSLDRSMMARSPIAIFIGNETFRAAAAKVQ
ncbi:hypothetical protein [Bradyrhizobium sp. USDA 3650]